MERKRSESTSSSGSFPTPIPNLYALQLMNGLPDEDPERQISESPIPLQEDTQNLVHNKASEPDSDDSDDEVDISKNDEIAKDVPSTMPSLSKRKSNSDVNSDREINNFAREPQSLGHGTKKNKKSKRRSSERVTVNNDNDADGPLEAPAHPEQPPKKSKKKHRSKHSKQEDQEWEDDPVDTQSPPITAPGPARSDDVLSGSQELPTHGSFNAAGSQRSGRKAKRQAGSLDRVITSELVVNPISDNELHEAPVDDESAERRRRKERKRERWLLGRVDELGLAGETLNDNDLGSTELNAVSSQKKKKKDKARKNRFEKDLTSEMAEHPARHEETDIPEHMRDFTKESEIAGPPTEEYIDGGATEGSPALARQRRRQGRSGASEKLLKTIADKQASHASLLAHPRDQDSEDEETSASHDNQVISPPPANDQPGTEPGTARFKSHNGPSRRTAATGGQAQQLNANTHSSAFIESNHALSTAEAPPSTAPGSQRASKRKLKRPFFERDQVSGARVPADPLADDAFAPVDPGRVPSGPVGTSKPDMSPAPSNVKRKKQGKSRAVSEDAIKHEPNGPTDSKPKLSSQYKSGPLTLAEQEQVCLAVESIREHAVIGQSEMNQMIHENPQRQKNPLHAQLWNAVAEACPTRSRKKVMEWCRQHFHNFVSRGTWTDEQDAELMQMIQIHGHKWSVIGGLINRHQKDVRDRYRNYLICQGASRSRYWSSEEEDKFFNVIEKAVDAIRKDLGQGDWDNKSVEDLINWGQISEAMGFERTRLQCLEKWKRLRAANAIPNRITLLLPMGQSSRLAKARKDLQRMTGEEKYLLACGIRDSNAVNEPEIPWEEIMTNVFDGKFQRQALLVTWGRLRETIANWEQHTTAECAAQIADMYEEDNGFLLDDRTVASRSREPTAELGTPSARGSTKHRRATKSKSLVPKAVARSKPTVDPEDDMSEGNEDAQLPDLLMRGGDRSRSRIDFEEVEESVFGEGDDQSDRDAERANGIESDTDARDRRHTQAAKRKRVRARAASLDLGANSDDQVSAVEFSPNLTQHNPENPLELQTKESKRKGTGKEKNTDDLSTRPLGEMFVKPTEIAIVKSPRKRGSTDNTKELTDGTQDRATTESPAKKRRTLHHKTYSSAAKKASRHRSPSTKSPKGINGGRLAIGTSSASTSMQLPPSSQLRAQGTYSDLSSDMDRDMSDIPDTRPTLPG